jgi:hypothetical protein
MIGPGAIRAGATAALACAIAAAAVHAQSAVTPEPVNAGDQIRLRLHGGGTLTARLLEAGPEYLRVQPARFIGNVLEPIAPTSVHLEMAADSMVAEVHDARIIRILFHADGELSVPLSSVRLLEVQRGRGRYEGDRALAFVYGFAMPFGVLVPSAALAGAACQCGVTGRMTGAAAATSLAIGIGTVLHASLRRGPLWVPGTTARDDEP